MENANSSAKNKVVDEIIEWVETILFSFLTVVLIFTFVLRTSEVIGSSMSPTFTGKNDQTGQTGDRLVYFSLMSDYENGDVVVINSEVLDEAIIKRVVAVPGQTIDIDFDLGEVYVDGELLDEEYIYEPTFTDYGAVQYPYTLQNDEFFVLGDNRNNSLDSRFFGPVQRDDILGKAVFRFYPLSEFGVIE
ncbi:MAG: signal peptidase I [Ruminococcus sp.]|nr:signal peptidase I [Ruminococcus sp.]